MPNCAGNEEYLGPDPSNPWSVCPQHAALSTEIAKIHIPAMLGTKEIDETDIEDGKYIRYDLLSGKLVYDTPEGGATVTGTLPISVTAGDVSIRDATNAQNGAVTAAQIQALESATVAQHSRQHALDSTSDHSAGSLTSPYIVGFDGTKLISTNLQPTDVASAVSLKHSIVTVSAPLALSNQAVSLVNNAVSPGTITTIDIDKTFAANSDLYLPTQKAVKGGIADHAALITGVHGLIFTAGQTLTIEASSVLNQDLTTDAGPTFAHLHLGDLASITTPDESWVGPSSTAGIYFKGGNIGVGYAAPDAKLCVLHTASSSVPALRVFSSGTLADNDIVRFQINGLTNGFRMFQDASSNVVYSFETGNVGIGTTAPGAKLQIDNSTLNPGLKINHSAAGHAAGWFVTNEYGLLVQSAANDTKYLLKLQGNSGGTAVDAMYVQTNGNVGIGTTAPLSKLCINGGLHVGGDSDAGDNNLIVDGTTTVTGAFGCNGVAAGTKSAHITDATGAADVITRANAILVVLEKFGFVATS